MSGEESVLLTDLYELTMAAAYFENRMFEPATFSLFVRNYPPDRGYLVSAGLESVVSFLESLQFRQDDLDYLHTTALFSEEFLHYLSSLRFSGDLFAIPEGRLYFRDEPLIEITAPIIEAQIVETFIINALCMPTCVATKAARCVHAAQGRALVDYSLRRTQGTDAGLKVARASYIAGFAGSSNVLAGKLFGVPIYGTMAHSFVTSFPSEIESFRAYAAAFPNRTVLLIDTYDTLSGARKAITVAREMRARGHKLLSVRLDSGDMADLSRAVRRLFDEAGLEEVTIFASGGFDEHEIESVLDQGAQIDAFGVGTKVGVSADAPYLDMAYKLVRYAGRPILKLSAGKRTLVGEKQVFRITDAGKLSGDIIALREETHPGEPLLQQVMGRGARLTPAESLEQIRSRFRDEFAQLPGPYKALRNPETYPIALSSDLIRLQEATVTRTRQQQLGEPA